jgi:hypothetical protein
VRSRFQPIHLVVLLVLLGAPAAFLYWRVHTPPIDALSLIQSLPPDQATHVFIDVNALRRGGILDLVAGSKAAEEPDYRKFVEQTGFDYRTDLDAVAAAFFHNDVYFVLRGRFQWKKLAQYATSQGGQCAGAICSMAGSTPQRHISFYELRSGVLALAVSAAERGVNMIGPNQWKTAPKLPEEPVWVSAPSFAFADVKDLPEGTHAFLSPLARSQHVIFAVGPAGSAAGSKAKALQIRLEVACDSPETASVVAGQLTQTTDLLKKMLVRDHMTPNKNDLSGVLVAGNFQQKDKTVTGTWPLDPSFVESLASGKVQ